MHDEGPGILLIEDNLLVQRVTKLLLKEMGCQVRVAASGGQALEYLAKERYDLIFLDVGLPDINGIELAKKIRTYHPDKANIPIIIVSAYSDENYLNQAAELGITEYIIKPITKNVCEAVIQKFYTLKLYQNKDQEETINEI